MSGEASVAERQELLLDKVAGLRFAYFGPVNQGEAPAWVDRWIDRTRLPYLVRVTVERASGTFRPWQDIVVATRATTNPGCINDASAAICDIVGP